MYHDVLNDILHKALSSANVPSRLEPTSLNRADTCVDTFAPSHLSMTASEVCAFPSIHDSL